MKEYNELLDIVRPKMDNIALIIIEREARELPDNYYVNITLYKHAVCDKATIDGSRGWLDPYKVMPNGDSYVTLYSGSIKYNSKGKKYELIGTNTSPERISEFPESIRQSLRVHNWVEPFDPKMGYNITVGYQEGNFGMLDMEKTKEIGEKAFGENYSRYRGNFNPEMVHEWR